MTHRELPHTTRTGLVLATVVAGGLLLGCESETPPETNDGELMESATQTASSKLTYGEKRERRERGRKLYVAECSGCHGEKGLADGPAAQVVDPKPRNFVREAFKFTNTVYGEPPLRADIGETIARGMPGSSMPAFDFLTDEERGLITDYVMYLANIDTEYEPERVVIGPEVPASPQSVQNGHKIYMRLGCNACHGDEGRGDGSSASTLKDSLGRKIEARDFRLGLFRRGRTAAELYRTFEGGITGTPMPSYQGNYTNEEAWDLARYVLSLPVPPPAPPSNPVEHGRQLVEEKQCFSCHVIEGRGGSVGPNLDVSAKKLRFAWVKKFLADPRAMGKIYHFMPYRMPDFGLAENEIEAIVTLLAEVAGRDYPEKPEPMPEIDSKVAAEGTLLYVIKCAECHNLGSVIPTPLAKQQGPDLIDVSQRLRFEWIPEWIANPLEVYPGTPMVDTNLTDEEIEKIRAFLWTTSMDAASN